MQQHQRALVQEPFDPCGGRGGRGRRRQGKTHQPGGFFHREALLVEQQADGHAPQQLVDHPVAQGRLVQGGQPAFPKPFVSKEPYRVVRRDDAGTHGGGAFVVQRGAGPRQPDGCTGDQAFKDAGDHPGVSLAHVAVAGDGRQWRDGFQQLADVVGCGGLFFQHTGGVPHGVRQIGEQDVVHQFRQSEQVRFTGQLHGLRGGGFKDGVSPAAGGDHRNGELGHPLHFPKFMERPFGVPAASRRGPADFQQPQAVQEVAARQIVGLAQIEIQYLPRGFGLQAQAFLLLFQIPLERDGGRGFGNRPQFVAHDKLTLDEAQRRGVAHADRGLQRFVKLRQAGAGALAQGGQRRGETRGFDDVGGRAVHVLFAEQAGGVGQPADGPIALAAAPEMLVPRGRGHARAVTAPAAQIGIGPRRPCRRDLHFGQALEQVVVLLGWRFRSKRGHMPRAADHGDTLEAFLFRLPQRFAHVRFAQGFPPRLPFAAFASGRFGPQRGHGFTDGVEQL